MSKLAAVILTAIVSVILTSILWVTGLVVAYSISASDPVLLSMEIDVPDRVVVGEEFTMLVLVSNPTDEDVDFGSIDIYDELLDGFDIKTVTPAPYDQDGTFGFTSHFYSDTLTPGEKREYRFEMKAAAVGSWSGDVDCCTADEDFVTIITSIEVTDLILETGAR